MLVFIFPTLVFADNFVAGKDYEVLVPDTSSSSLNTVIPVTEFFSYGCPWCYRLDGSLTNWLNHQGKKIRFTRVPVIFNQDWTYYAKAWYAADLLDIESRMTPLLFKAVQIDKLPLASDEAMKNFFIKEGVDKETAHSAFSDSTAMTLKLQEGNALMVKYRIRAVPAVVINHCYKTDLQMAGSEERFFKILDYLVSKPC